ncbi:M14 family metallopeptidase [Rubrolithibacter danxiaensis]|uniref:M14 family metallopeptidase n=1 Tax=Rubrolithibacter danxiaensis TaxID=3390805 RepID=UPI003BF82D9E
MKRLIILLIFFLTVAADVSAQKIMSPSEFLGYNLGDQFTPHDKVLSYFNYIAARSKNVQIKNYGKTYEGRPLILAFISSQKNIERLDEIRRTNLQFTGLQQGTPNERQQPVIVWLSYNVHGNEASSTEAAMEILYRLSSPSDTTVQNWLNNTLVIIDPCLNPDGRERYINFYNPVRSLQPDPLPESREHAEPWPGGRSNHYYFDLNRDWAWQSQAETQQRMAVYNQWMPQVHADFHEQSVNSPYYFAPAAEPFHEVITPWQREFQTLIGRNNARVFDQKGWSYFTRERFDLLYPSYGDTYPTYNGAIGMTFEQAGSGRAGLKVITSAEDTLTLKDRIEHHLTSGLTTIKTASGNAARLLKEYKNYFYTAKNKPPGEYKTYIVKGENPEKLKSLGKLLKANQINFGFGGRYTGTGFNYFSLKIERFTVSATDMLINSNQPKSVLLKVLFEPHTAISDSNTYDITAWALPYAFGIKTSATTAQIDAPLADSPSQIKKEELNTPAIGYGFKWDSFKDAEFLAVLLKKKLNIKVAELPFEVSGKNFSAGSFIIFKSLNPAIAGNFDANIKKLAEQAGVISFPISSGMVDKGSDFGSAKFHTLKTPKVALFAGEETSSLSVGEIWHFFEQELKYPLSILPLAQIEKTTLNKFNVIILPDGGYKPQVIDQLQNWIENGGKLIALGEAVKSIADRKIFNLKSKNDSSEAEKDVYEYLKPYENRERESIKTEILGAIYRVDLDNTHPLGYGFPDYYYTLKTNSDLFQFLSSGWNVGVLKKNNYVSGFAGAETKRKLTDGLLFGTEEIENGIIVYLVDDPLFRGFWENGKLLFCNALFMVGW